jgi:DNA-binding NtrC family response regulator
MDRGIDVLVLDDEITVCERLEEYLTERDFRVETFTESPAALARLEEKTFDVVVTDLKMREVDGLEVLRRITERNLPTRVILISAYGTMETFRDAEYSGVFEIVLKPFRMNDILKVIRRAAAKSRRSRGDGEDAKS